MDRAACHLPIYPNNNSHNLIIPSLIMPHYPDGRSCTRLYRDLTDMDIMDPPRRERNPRSVVTQAFTRAK